MPVLVHCLRLFFDTSQFQQEGVILCGFLKVAEASGRATMAGVHIGSEQHQVVIGFQLPQFGSPFRWLPILYLRIVQSGGDQQVGVVLGLDLVIW